MVFAHLSDELVIPVHLIEALWMLDEKVGDRRVVAGVLAVVLCPVDEHALISLAQQGVKWFVLPCADVDVTKAKGYHVSQPFYRILGVRGCCQKLWCGCPEIDDSLDRGPRLENFDR